MNKNHLNIDENSIKNKLMGRCLVAFDLDKTVLELGRDEGVSFIINHFGPIKSIAEMKFKIAAITGNRMDEVIKRFSIPLLDMLCKYDKINLNLIKQFHLFSNGGGVYVNFKDEDFTELEKKLVSQTEADRRAIIKNYFFKLNGKEIEFKSRFIDEIYIERTQIVKKDVEIIADILEDFKIQYWNEFINNYESKSYRNYYIYDKKTENESKLQKNIKEAKKNNKSLFPLTDKEGQYLMPFVDKRHVLYGNNLEACTQITLKPVLSYKFLKRNGFQESGPRKLLIQAIQKKINQHPEIIRRYIVKAGGRTSIDITLEVVNKKYAIEYLITKEDLQGVGKDKEMGSETIFLGDEVVLGGNDIDVADIPGILVLAVNPDKRLVPFKSNIIVNYHFTGPAATTDWLNELNKSATKLLDNCLEDEKLRSKYLSNHRTALDEFKLAFFRHRIKEQIEYFNEINHVDVFSTLYVIITLLLRPEQSQQFAKLFLNHIDELFKIFEDIKHNPKLASEIARGLGASRK